MAFGGHHSPRRCGQFGPLTVGRISRELITPVPTVPQPRHTLYLHCPSPQRARQNTLKPRSHAGPSFSRKLAMETDATRRAQRNPGKNGFGSFGKGPGEASHLPFPPNLRRSSFPPQVTDGSSFAFLQFSSLASLHLHILCLLHFDFDTLFSSFFFHTC